MQKAVFQKQSTEYNQEGIERWPIYTDIYIILMAIALLSHLWLMIFGLGISDIPSLVWIIRLTPIPLTLFLGQIWKDKGFRILSIYFLFFFFRCFIVSPKDIFCEEMSQSILSALWLFISCYGLGHVLYKDKLRFFLLGCTVVWTIWIMGFCFVGIISAWTGNSFRILDRGWIGFSWGSSLTLIYTSTVSGSIISISIIVSIIAAFSTKNKWIRKLFIFSLVPMIIVLALTDSRTAYISYSAGMAAIIGLYTTEKIIYERNHKKNIKGKTLWIFCVVIAVLAFIFVLFFIMKITPIFNQIRQRGLVDRAYAEEQIAFSISHRGFSGDDVFSGRIYLWQQIIDHIKQNPMILLCGNTKINPLRGIDSNLVHCHNIYFQILLESGLPGLLLFVGYIITICRSIKNAHNRKSPLWIKILPCALITVLVGDLAECFSWLRASQCPMSTIFFVAAGIINAYSQKMHYSLRPE